MKETVLLTGGTGYIGGRLLPKIEANSLSLRCLTRDPDRLRGRVAATTEIIQGDILSLPSIVEAMQGIHTAYYLVHLMAGSTDFEQADRQAAENFSRAASQAGLQKIIYLGGLGSENEENLSPHLRSRQEVGQILRDSGVQCIEFRASIVIGAGSLSFELVRSLTNRLPIMICPRWLATPTQPISVDDTLEYLVAAGEIPPGESRVFEIGGRDIVTYGDIIREYARQRNMRRWLIKVPFLTPYLSSLWLELVTPATAEIGRHLIEGLRNPTIVQNRSAESYFSIKPIGIREAITKALEPL